MTWIRVIFCFSASVLPYRPLVQKRNLWPHLWAIKSASIIHLPKASTREHHFGVILGPKVRSGDFAVFWLVGFMQPIEPQRLARRRPGKMPARVYLNPNTGRFWTMDTYEGSAAEPASLHKYVYAADNPINRMDPSGHVDAEIALDPMMRPGFIQLVRSMN